MAVNLQCIPDEVSHGHEALRVIIFRIRLELKFRHSVIEDQPGKLLL